MHLKVNSTLQKRVPGFGRVFVVPSPAGLCCRYGVDELGTARLKSLRVIECSESDGRGHKQVLLYG